MWVVNFFCGEIRLFLAKTASRGPAPCISSPPATACLVANASSTLRKILNEMNEIPKFFRFDFKFHEKWKALKRLEVGSGNDRGLRRSGGKRGRHVNSLVRGGSEFASATAAAGKRSGRAGS